MKRNLLPALLFVLMGLTAQAQNFQPFRKGPTYHYIAQDSIYSLRVDSVKVVGGDSVFVFNPIARKGGTTMGPSCVPLIHGYAYAVDGNNQFGNKLVKKLNGDYIFRTKTNQEYLLKTKVTVGQTWNVTPAITATLTSKSSESVLTIPDSVLSYSLSNGKIIKLSKNFGFIKTPNFASYSDPYFRSKDFDFYAIPEKGMGQVISSPFAIYNFQPGDKFAFHETYLLSPFSTLCSEAWIRQEVISRTQNLNGDTIIYTIQEQILTKGYGSPTAPSPFCQIPTATTLQPARSFQLVITRYFDPATNALSQGFYAPPHAVNFEGMVATGIYKKSQYNFREQIRLANHPYDYCPKAFASKLDRGAERGYTRGLGETYRATFFYGDVTVREMEAYVKGTETYGTWISLGQMLATQEELNKKPLVQAFPNPFTSELTFTFGETSGKTQLVLRNTLGQLVWKQEMAAAPDSEVKVNLPELAKGLYILQASQNGKVFTSRLVKE